MRIPFTDYEITFRRVEPEPEPISHEEEEKIRQDHAKWALDNLIIPNQDFRQINFFGLRATAAVSPYVEDFVLLVPSGAGEGQYENYVRRRMGGPSREVCREVPRPTSRVPGVPQSPNPFGQLQIMCDTRDW